MTAFSQLSRRFKVERKIGPVTHDDTIPADRWTINARTEGWHTETIYEVLRWDDLVRRDFSRSWIERISLLLGALVEALRGAVVLRLFRLNWRFAIFVIYPWAALFAAISGAFLLAYGASVLADLALPLPAMARGGITVVIAFATLHFLSPRLRKAHVYHLLDGWIFSWQQAAGRHADFDARLDRFSRHVVEAVRETEADEVLIVGHSTGSTIAVELAARALALDPDFGRTGPAVGLLTIGSCLPIVSFVRTASLLRQSIARLVTTPSLLWVEYQAPQDALNGFGFDPVRDLKLELGTRRRFNPKIRSTRFKETLLPSTYRKIRWNFFRIHFHFLMANEVPGEYDYLMITCGPVTLADRIEDPAAAVRAAYDTGFPHVPGPTIYPEPEREVTEAPGAVPLARRG